MSRVTFDREMYLRLKRRYKKAVKDKEESFMFKGNEYLTTYAKYLLEYLSSKFK